MMMGNRNVNERRPVASMIDAWLDAMFVACAQSGCSVIHAPATVITADMVKRQLSYRLVRRVGGNAQDTARRQGQLSSCQRSTLLRMQHLIISSMG